MNSLCLIKIGIVICTGILFITLVNKKSKIGNKMSEKVDFFISGSADIVEQWDIDQQADHFKLTANERRKEIINGTHVLFAQFGLVPQVRCPTAVRAGGVGKGGKWVCNPWRAPENCILYSVGIYNDTTFESAMYQLTKQRCRIFSFEYTDQPKSIFDPFNGTFNKWQIGNKSDNLHLLFTVQDIAEQLAHKKADFVKLDVQENEYHTVLTFLNSEAFKSRRLEICQLIVQFRDEEVKRDLFLQTMREIEKNGFLMFYKDANTHLCRRCDQYSYIHESCLTQYGILGEPFNFNFD